jgi:pimeloyl-ACP methyl ester carboxylesterase
MAGAAALYSQSHRPRKGAAAAARDLTMKIRSRRTAGLLGVIALIALGVILAQLPVFAAGGLLHPFRRRVGSPAPDGCEDVRFEGAGVALRGWRCQARKSRRGTLVYLHGVADNRGSGAGIVRRFVDRGFDVIAYDSRAHGDSEGAACTYGYFEKNDLRRVLDRVPPGPVVLVGTSLGAAVALQATADDPRISAVVAAETFSDLQTIAHERAPFFLSEATIDKAFSLAETRGRFEVAAVSPVAAAARITVPVLLIHGALDRDTPPEHSERVFGALRGPKRLILVPGAGHNKSLAGDVWQEIEAWIETSQP